MSHHTTHIHVIRPGLRRRIDLFLAEKGQGFNAALLLRQHLAEILLLEAMSDAELRACGLRRDDILPFVFEACFADDGQG